MSHRYQLFGKFIGIISPLLLTTCYFVRFPLLDINLRMDFIFGSLEGESLPFSQDIFRCPFLRNINEPTNFSVSIATAFPMPVKKEKKGPIFEDGLNFDMAFRLFHGQSGVVPLSGRSSLQIPKSPAEHSPAQFHPLAANAASISLSGFGPGGPFGFEAFSEKWKISKKKPGSSKKESSSKEVISEHEATSYEWLQKGHCPIAKSYRAVNHVLPLVAKALQLPPGMKVKCPPAIVAASSALAMTAFAKNFRSQPLPAKILVIGLMGMAANIHLGIWREHTRKLSPSWFAVVHAAVLFIAMLRKSVLMPKTAMAFTLASSILARAIGSRAEKYRLKAISSRELVNQSAIDGISRSPCRDIIDSRQVPLSSTDVFCPSFSAVAS